MGIDLPKDSSIPFWGLHPKDYISYYRDNGLAMITDCLFIIIRNWETQDICHWMSG